MRYLSLPFGIALAFLIVVLAIPPMTDILAEPDPVSGAMLFGSILASFLLVVALVPVGEMGVLVPLVLLTRGPRAIGWLPLSGCTSFTSWLLFNWDFYGKGGRHEGLRVLGLEVAIQGTRE